MPTDKDKEFYAASVEAWYLTKLEHDKSLLFLSSGGIGLLITLITTRGIDSVVFLVLYIAALLSFVFCLISVLCIFNRNSTHIENIVKNANASSDPLLKVLDVVAIFSFVIAIILSVVIGVATAANSLKERKVFMTKDSKDNSISMKLEESFNGVNKLHPKYEDLKKSFNGAENLRPNPPADTDSSTDGSTQSQGHGQDAGQDKEGK